MHFRSLGNTVINKFIRTGACIALVLLLLWSGSALAAVPANTLVRNTATLTGANLPPGGVSASVDVRIDLVPAAPTLSKPTILTQMPDDNSAAENQSSAIQYRVTNNANGPDTFLITAEAFTAVNLSGHAGAAVFSQTSITLGATAAIAAAAAGATSVTVYYDGSSDAAVNSIAAGDPVRIGAHDYQVASVSENLAAMTATIVLQTPLQEAVAAGVPVREYGLFTLTIASVGAVVTSGEAAYIDVSTRATSQAGNSRGLNLFDADSATDSAGNGANGHRTWIVSSSFGKYVRNVTRPNGDATYGVTFNNATFFSSAGRVVAGPGDVVEYALVIRATAAGLPAGPVTDGVPAYTAYRPGSFAINGVPVADSGVLPLIGGYSIGPLQGAQTLVITFQVTVNSR